MTQLQTRSLARLCVEQADFVDVRKAEEAWDDGIESLLRRSLTKESQQRQVRILRAAALFPNEHQQNCADDTSRCEGYIVDRVLPPDAMRCKKIPSLD